MKTILLFSLLCFCKVSVAQRWQSVGNTGIEHLSVKYPANSFTYFKKDSSAIGMPASIADDFYQLFLQQDNVFKLIMDSCKHFRNSLLDDQVDSVLKKYDIKHVVFFKSREVEKEKTDNELWNMTSLYGQGLPCRSTIYIRREGTGMASQIRFLSIRRAMCQL